MHLSTLPRAVRTLASLGAAALVATACSESSSPEDLDPFTLNFAAVYQGDLVTCGSVLPNLGPANTVTAEISDLRFYVSNLKFYNEAGDELSVELASNAFQYNSADGNVALIDLTSTTGGACGGAGLSAPEGTARTNTVITGQSHPDQVHSISFDVGIPQHLMKTILATHTDADAPSPLAEMHWSWAYAYRHFVMNFTMVDGATPGEGYVHIGSTGCGGDGTRAMTDRETCDLVNTPTVRYGHFHMTDTVAVDIGAVLANLDFQVEQTMGGPMVPGVATHSMPMQPDTPIIFMNFGLDAMTGVASAATNAAFVVR
jgi:uncharacterized repeat protein (TIGR04052 family)